MAGRIPSTFCNIVDMPEDMAEEEIKTEDELESIGNGELESIGNGELESIGNGELESIGNDELESIGNDELESIGNDSMHVNMNTTVSDTHSLDLDDNNSESQIDPGNFSESDIEDDASSNCCLSLTDGLGCFPESDFESQDEMSDYLSDAGISFNSDVGSPMHSSSLSYPVSEDRDDREEATPLPVHLDDSYQAHTGTSSYGKSADYETYNESEVSGPKAKKQELKVRTRRFRTSIISKRKFSMSRAMSPHSRKTHKKKSEKATKKVTFDGKRKALTVMMLSDEITPNLYSTPCDSERKEKAGSSPSKSLSIPILDLCITEDEGYLGMAEDVSEDSDKEKDENEHPLNRTDL